MKVCREVIASMLRGAATMLTLVLVIESYRSGVKVWSWEWSSWTLLVWLLAEYFWPSFDKPQEPFLIIGRLDDAAEVALEEEKMP